MTVLNRYTINQKVFIQKKMQQPLIGFTNNQGNQATWDDIVVKFQNKVGITQNFYFNNQNKTNPKFNSDFNENDYLPEDSHQLLFAYLLDILKESTNPKDKESKLAIAKKFLGILGQNPALMGNDEIQNVIDTLKSALPLRSFFKWLHNNLMIPASCRPRINDNRQTLHRRKNGDDAILGEISKLPDEKGLLALGAIFHDVIPQYDNDKTGIKEWDSSTCSVRCHLDVFTCTMFALAMASPNRAAAEQVILSKQRLQSAIEVVDGKKQKVYFLNWRGSKGYLDNQKHFNREMAVSLDRALHFTSIVTEPARVLARFYEKPELALDHVLLEFLPSLENLSLLNPSMNKPTMLIHLGLLLGFYDNTDKIVRVTKDTLGAMKHPSTRGNEPKYIKKIVNLSPFDKLVFIENCQLATNLLGKKFSRKGDLSKLLNDDHITVSDFQNYQVSINQLQLIGYNRKQTKKEKYSNALFTFTQKQITHKIGSHFLLVALSNLENYFSRELKKKGTIKTIFERFGFSRDFKINPHQFRHWQNDYLAKNGLPHLLISMLSGRKSPEQTLQYIHTSDAQNASVIADIMCIAEENEDIVQDSIQKRLHSKNQYDVAIQNLSPTFVTEVGFCTQDLTLSPCTYMNDFDSQCTLCSSSCHVAHEESAICLLKNDLRIQTKRLEIVQGAINFASSEEKQKWYSTHYKNTYMLKELINVMSDENTKEGSIIRILSRSNVIRVTNLDSQIVEHRHLALPDAEKAVQAAINSLPSKASDSKTNFLGFLDSI